MSNSTTWADEHDEDYSIEREADMTYIHIDRNGNEDAWGYCIDGIGCIWYDSTEELEEDYTIGDITYYYKSQLQE